MTQSAPHPTKTAIMDAAERLMAGHGVNGISIRAILADAGANPAALHYHFGSRDRLIEAILARRGRDMNMRRRQMLDQIEAREDSPDVHDIVAALVDPFLEMLRRDGDPARRFLRFLARLQLDRDTIHRDLEDRYFPDIRERITGMLIDACPHLDRKELERRVTMTLDTMFYSLGNTDLLAARWKGEALNEALAEYANSLKQFLAGGLAAGGPDPAAACSSTPGRPPRASKSARMKRRKS